MHLKQIEEARALATPVTHVFTDVDTSPAFSMQYNPQGGDGGTAATVALIQDGDMTVLVGGSAPTGNDTFGTAGVLDTSAALYDTVGEFADYVNGLVGYSCIIHCRRAQGMETILAKSATSFINATGLTFYLDASASDIMTIPISGGRFVNNGPNGMETDADGQCENQLLYVAANLGLTGNGSMRLYSCSQSSDGGALTFTMTDDTALAKGGTDLDEIFFQATRGERIVVEFFAATSLDDIAQLEVIGRTAVLKNDRIVASKNY